MTDWITGEVKKIHFWNSALFSLTIDAPINSFIAGQFTKLALDINGERIQRAYSYVNAPCDPNLEFYLISVPNGRLSPHLASLKPGDKVYLANKASGFFILDEIPKSKTLWMFATGTALGPYISMLKDGKNLENFKNIVLIHAVRYASDLSYFSQITALKEYYKGKLRIQTVVSREKVSGSLTGRIPMLIENGLLEQAVGLPINLETSHVMLCGNPQMVQDTKKLLKETRKMTRHLRSKRGHITIENYW